MSQHVLRYKSGAHLGMLVQHTTWKKAPCRLKLNRAINFRTAFNWTALCKLKITICRFTINSWFWKQTIRENNLSHYGEIFNYTYIDLGQISCYTGQSRHVQTQHLVYQLALVQLCTCSDIVQHLPPRMRSSVSNDDNDWNLTKSNHTKSS